MNGWGVSEHAKYVIMNGILCFFYGICRKSGIFKSHIFKVGVV